MTGYYGFLDYAVTFWHHHFKRATNSESGAISDLKAEALRSAKRVFDVWASSQPQDQQIRNLVQEQPAENDTEQQYKAVGDIYGIHQRIISIRKVIEAIDHSSLPDSHRTSFLELDGIAKFKCPNLQCTKFSTGFCDEHDRDLHVRAHERPFKCLVDGCYARVIGYPTSQALDAHSKRFHDEDSGTALSFPKQSGTEVSAMHAAARQGNLALVKALHATGIPLDLPIKPGGGLTPMVLAARNGHANVCEYLVRQGVDGCEPTYGGISPASEAIKREDIELFRCLWHKRKKAFDNSRVDQLVILILHQGAEEHLNELLKDLKPEQVRANLPAILSAAYDISRVNVAQRKITLPQTQRRLLHSIVGRAFPPLYEADGCTLQKGIRVSDSELFSICAREILTSGRKTDTMPILHLACLHKSNGCIEFLLDFAGPLDLRTQNKNGCTPLHMLFERGAHLDDFTGACFQGVFKRLIQIDSVAANIQDNMGNLPLYYSCFSKCDKDIFLLLLQLTSNPNHQNQGGMTALEVAVIRQLDEQVISLMRSRRVDLNIMTKSGETLALLIGRKCTNETIHNLLKEN